MGSLAGSRLLNLSWEFEQKDRIIKIAFLPKADTNREDLYQAIKEVFPEVGQQTEYGGECFAVASVPDDIADIDVWIVKQYAKILFAFDNHASTYHVLD